MANLSKEERKRLAEQQQQERDLLEQEHLARMPQTLLGLCARAQASGIDYTIFTGKTCDGKTVGGVDAIRVQFSGRFQTAELTQELTMLSTIWQVESCIREFEYYEGEIARYEAKMQLRREVLAKLSDAEKDALGLKF